MEGSFRQGAQKPNSSREMSQAEAHKKFIAEHIAKEGIQGTILGMHDYRSDLRELGSHFSKKTPQEFFEHIKAHPVRSFKDYFRNVVATNSDLHRKILNDMALYPGIVNRFEGNILMLNQAKTPEEARYQFEELKNFFL